MAETSIGFDFDSLVKRRDMAGRDANGDESMIDGLRLGAEEAYEMLIARYQQPVYNLAYRLMDNSGDADDVVQEVFLKVFRNIGSFRGQSSLKTWIYRIAVNEAHNYRRWFSRRRKREVGLETEERTTGRCYGNLLPDPGKSPFDMALRAESRTLTEEALSRMKPVFREAVILRDIEDLSYEEITDILNISIGTVKSRILRGRETLRRKLQARLGQARAVGWSPQPAEQE